MQGDDGGEVAVKYSLSAADVKALMAGRSIIANLDALDLGVG